MKLFCLLVAVLSLGAASARAQAPPPSKTAPAGGAPLLPTDSLSAFRPSGGSADLQVQTVPVSGQPFAGAMRVATLRQSQFPYSLQLIFRTTTPVQRGDVLLGTFYLRRVAGGGESGEGHAAFIFEMGRAPFAKSADYAATAGNDWKRFDVPFVALDTYAPGEAQINFQVGFAPQTIELGGISVTNYGASVKVGDLPQTQMTYAGREPNAPWRKAAQARIEKIRKGNLTVVVVDGKGKPVPNAAVHVQMTRHAFGFGSAVAAETLTSPTPDGAKYRAIVFSKFNKIVFENDLKWPKWEETANQARTLDALKLLKSHNIAVRGHNLIWPSWRNTPRDLQTLQNDPAALRQRIDAHLKEEASRFAGQLAEWDVVNEPFDNHDVTDILGRDSLVSWFKQAHEADPHALLFLNDYPPLDGAATSNPHLNNFEQTLRFLQAGGAPLGGIGFQCHFGRNPIPPVRLLSGLDRFAKLGLPMEATEFDINTTDEALQADYTRDFLLALFSHPVVNGIVMWGFWEGRHWLPNAALWRRDWTLKPNGQVWLDLVTKTWWTNAHGKTDKRGKYQTRGFLGAYLVTARMGTRTKTVGTSLEKNGTTLRIVLDK